MDAIVTYDLTKEYGGRPVLESLNLQVPQGQAFACVGQRGWGKTTLIRLLSGLANPTSGECTVLGLSPTYEPQRLHAVAGTVLDSARLYAKMTLWENLRFFAGIHGFDDNDALERSSFLLHKLDIWEGRDLLVESLPTGVLRRASLARALMHRPQILLADEPPSSMDQESLEAIQALMGCVAQEEGVSLFLCCSNMEYAQLLCQNFALLKQGVLGKGRCGIPAERCGGGIPGTAPHARRESCSGRIPSRRKCLGKGDRDRGSHVPNHRPGGGGGDSPLRGQASPSHIARDLFRLAGWREKEGVGTLWNGRRNGP